MKKSLILLITAASLIISCKKDKSNPKTNEPTVLLTKIIKNTEGDSDYGEALASFTYSGTRLTKADITVNSEETHAFNYDGNGKLTGTTITSETPFEGSDVKSVIGYSGNDINKITFYKAGNVVTNDITLTFSNGRISRYIWPNNVDNSYTYNAKGNNIKEVSTELIGSTPTDKAFTRNSTSFDDKKNLSSALPYWVYFRYFGHQAFTRFPGVNNPLSSDEHGTFAYEYNSEGYPSTITFDGLTEHGPGRESYKYVYMIVK